MAFGLHALLPCWRNQGSRAFSQRENLGLVHLTHHPGPKGCNDVLADGPCSTTCSDLVGCKGDRCRDVVRG